MLLYCKVGWGQALLTGQNVQEFEQNANVTNPTLTSLNVLETYPLPRHKQAHTLNRNTPFASLRFQPVHGPGMTAQTYANIHLELAKYWNYYLLVSPNAKVGVDDITKELIQVANQPQNQNLPRVAKTFWAQISPDPSYYPSNLLGTYSAKPNYAPIVQTGMPPYPTPPGTAGAVTRNIYPAPDAGCGGVTSTNPNGYSGEWWKFPMVNQSWLPNDTYLHGINAANQPLFTWYNDNDPTTTSNVVQTTYNASNKYCQSGYEVKHFSPYKDNFTSIFNYSLEAPFRYDGLLQKWYLDGIKTALTNRPNRPTIDLIVENGEVLDRLYIPNDLQVFPGNINYRRINQAYEKDKILKQWWISNIPPPNPMYSAGSTEKFNRYQANAFLAYDNAYKSAFLNPANGEKYLEYRLAADLQFNFNWKEARAVNSKMKPASLYNGYHSGVDFYPLYAQWRTGSGAWNGWDKVIASRKNEIWEGDKLFAPFVSAGWCPDEEKNIRPAQWLGLLKLLAVAGAEFYHTAFFYNTWDGINYDSDHWRYQYPMNPNADFNQKSFIWQFTTPSYAQGITTRFEALLYNGRLLEGDEYDYTYNYKQVYLQKDHSGIVLPNTTATTAVRGNQSFSQQSGYMSPTYQKYAISSTLQPTAQQNFTVNYAPNSNPTYTKRVTIKLQHPDELGLVANISFNARAQGSTYIFEKDGSNQPIFYQLDSWHQWEHPTYWSKNFEIEAELNDSKSSAAPTLQTITVVPSTSTVYDFASGYTTSISLPADSMSVTYDFTPRVANQKYKVKIFAQNPTATAKTINAMVITPIGTLANISITIPAGANFGTVYFNGSPTTKDFNSAATANTPTSIKIKNIAGLRIDKILVEHCPNCN